MFGLHAGWARSCCVLLFVAWMGRKASSKLRQNSHRSRHIHNNFPFDIFLHIFLYRHERIMCVTSLAARLTCTSSSVPESFEHHMRESWRRRRVVLSLQIQFNFNNFLWILDGFDMLCCVLERRKKRKIWGLSTLDFRFQTLFFFTQAERRTTS